jgi:hypothetical protein
MRPKAGGVGRVGTKKVPPGAGRPLSKGGWHRLSGFDLAGLLAGR